MELPLAAVDPDPLKVTARGATPPFVEADKTAVGGVVLIGAVTVTTVVATLVWLEALLTVSLAVCDPAVVYVCEGVAPVPVEPSPKSHW